MIQVEKFLSPHRENEKNGNSARHATMAQENEREE
jgi:hypothetical protein